MGFYSSTCVLYFVNNVTFSTTLTPDISTFLCIGTGRGIGVHSLQDKNLRNLGYLSKSPRYGNKTLFRFVELLFNRTQECDKFSLTFFYIDLCSRVDYSAVFLCKLNKDGMKITFKPQNILVKIPSFNLHPKKLGFLHRIVSIQMLLSKKKQ